MFMRRFGYAVTMLVALLGVALMATATPAQADTFNLTSCHLSGGCGTVTQFGTVTLTQVGANVTFDVVLNSGNRFVETGAGGNSLFVFNDTTTHTVSNISATLDGNTVTITGGLSGATNTAPNNADGTGDFTAAVFCTTASSCNGGSTPNINDLHFTVQGAMIADLTTANANGNIFVADILCNQTGCGGGTGPVDVSAPVPEPTTLLMVGTVLAGLGAAWRRSRSRRGALAV